MLKAKNPKMLYIGDNAGEIAFDKLLIETISRKGRRCNICCER